MKVWDLATRLYHWFQAVLFIALIASGFSGNGPHVQLGLALFTLVFWRILWGLVGSQTSRFSQFIRSPITVLRYLTGKEPTQPGHNPAGGWMVVTMIFALFLQCFSGLALAGLLDNMPYMVYWLTDTVFSALESMHYILARVLPMLILTHVGAIVVYKLRSKPLVMAMLTGVQNKMTETGELYFVSQRRAITVFATAILVTAAIVVIA
ncbi:cytochrome b/b6 domain-containing protein [Photobacterium alginatilyticum]|uniref:Hydrogenase n=1 Tax=Photobacterium alginatilyticum TaxID=1775171 RepID=A0ABW9YTR1_9GAMM|nr:cytochrome b/b6 domain-containing protein [Photobacterium alginatilyticum]NBI56181.1 hydrogenase [Photobacterium alginatilyticum]